MTSGRRARARGPPRCTLVLPESIKFLIVAYFIGALAVVSIGFAGTSFWPIMITIFLSGFFVIGVQLSLNACITNYYPTAIRGTASGGRRWWDERGRCADRWWAERWCRRANCSS